MERDSTRVFTCDDPLVEQAVRVIRARATGRVTVGSLLGSLPASRRSLETRFKRATGRTLREEIVRVRLAHARALLRGSRLTIAGVAAESGFGSVQRFHSVFRKAEGMSPGALPAKRRDDGNRGSGRASLYRAPIPGTLPTHHVPRNTRWAPRRRRCRGRDNATEEEQCET